MPRHSYCDALFSVDFFDLESVYSSEMAGYVLLYYDYLLTLSDEVDRFWHRGPHSWASIIFFANRYIALLGHLPFVWSVYADPCKVGNIQPILNKSHGALIFLLHVLTSAILVMRVYALYFQNKLVLAIVGVEALAAMGIGFWVIARPLSDTGTGLPQDRDQTAAAFAGLLVLDFTVFALSTFATYRSMKLGRRNEPFLRRLFVDGFVYYGATWSVNLINIIFLLTARRPVELATPVFANILSVVMVSRLMINLHDPMLRAHMSTSRGDTDGTYTSSREGYISTFPDGIVFASATQAEMSIELGAVDLRQDSSLGSIPHGASFS
jgi:hypothetical protein